MTVGNVGTADSKADLKVFVISPFYLNFREGALAPGTTYIVKNPSPAVPEMITFTVPAAQLAAGASREIKLGVEQVPDGPQLYDGFDTTIFATTDAQPTGNYSSGTIGLPINPRRSPPEGVNPINAFFVYTQPILKAGRATPLTIRVGNASEKSAKTGGMFTFVSPYNVKVNRADEAFKRLDPTYYHDETDSRVPDICSVPVPKEYLVAGPSTPIDQLETLTIPLIAYPGSYANRAGRGHLAVGEGDFDTLLAVSTGRITIMQPLA